MWVFSGKHYQKKRVGVGMLAILALASASLFSSAAAAQADYVAPEELSVEGESNWGAWSNLEGEEALPMEFSECSILIGDSGGYVSYWFNDEEQPTGFEEVSGMIESFSVSTTLGGGNLGVLINRLSADNVSGAADIYVEIPVGVQGIDLDSVVEVFGSSDLGLSEDATARDLLNALEASGDTYYIIALEFITDNEAELQWFAFASETFWFGTDAEWFLNDPSCGKNVIEPLPEVPNTPRPPVSIETAR